MTTKLYLKCDGCNAEASSEPVRKTFTSFSGRSYGFGEWHAPTMDEIVPPGWVWSDPYTACTYCPACWRDISGPSEDVELAKLEKGNG